MDRAWWAPRGGIYLCLALVPRLLAEHWGLYGLGMGVAVCEVLREWGVPARIRWVNDILVGGRKAAGLLAEGLTAPGSGQPYLLLGLGLNVNARRFPPEAPEATSLRRVTGRRWPIAPLAAHILARAGHVVGLLHHWEAGWLLEGPEAAPANPVVRAWRGLSDTLGRRVVYGLDAERAPEGTGLARDVAEDGALLLRLEDGVELRVETGEVRYLGPA
nr:hypothetical protein [Dissulfurirhabdus thermomarina]